MMNEKPRDRSHSEGFETLPGHQVDEPGDPHLTPRWTLLGLRITKITKAERDARVSFDLSRLTQWAMRGSRTSKPRQTPGTDLALKVPMDGAMNLLRCPSPTPRSRDTLPIQEGGHPREVDLMSPAVARVWVGAFIESNPHHGVVS